MGDSFKGSLIGSPTMRYDICTVLFQRSSFEEVGAVSLQKGASVTNNLHFDRHAMLPAAAFMILLVS